MHVLLLTTLLAGLAAAQSTQSSSSGLSSGSSGSSGSSSGSSSSSSSNSSSFDTNSVDLTTRNQWCSGETANCPILCGGPAFTKENTCTGSSLAYTCTCSNGSAPANIVSYLDTLPNHICQATFAQCNQQNPGSSQCKTCGTLQATSVPSSTSSSSMAAATSTTGSSSGAASPSATKKSDANALKRDAAVGLAGLVAALVV